MKPRELTRRHLEALVVAQAVVDPAIAEQLLERIDPLCVSSAVCALLTGIADRELEVTIETKGQRELAERVDHITVRELRGIDAFSLDTLVALLNRLPQCAPAERAWERDLAAGLDSEAAA